jgi:hypothetical protein
MNVKAATPQNRTSKKGRDALNPSPHRFSHAAGIVALLRPAGLPCTLGYLSVPTSGKEDFRLRLQENGRHEETRTPDLYRVKGAFCRNRLNFNGTHCPVEVR